MVLDGNNVFDDIGGSDFAESSNVIRLVGGQQGLFRKQRHPIIIAGGMGGRTTRHSEYKPPWMQQPRRQTDTQNYRVPPRPKKPIPVGERFRLPETFN